MSALSFTSVPEKITPVFNKGKKLGVGADTVLYWIRMYVPEDSQEYLHFLAHERVHIKQNWRYSWLIPALCRALTDKAAIYFEAPAYAAGVRAGRNIDKAASAMKKGLENEKSTDYFKKKIQKYV